MFTEYNDLLERMGLSVRSENVPKPSTFGEELEETTSNKAAKKKNSTPNLLAKELDGSNYKRESFTHFRKIILAMYEDNAVLMQKNGYENADFLALKNSYSAITKSQYCVIISGLFGNNEIYDFFLSHLTPEVKTVWDAMIWEGSLADTDILAFTGVNIASNTERKYHGDKSYIESELRKEFKILVHEIDSKYDFASRSYLKTFTLEMPLELKRVLRDYYEKPTNYNFNPLQETPKTEYVTTSETEIFVNLLNLVTYNQQGNIKKSGSGKVMASSANKMRKNLNITEFYDNLVAKELQNLKTYLLASLVVSEDTPPKEQTVIAMLKSLVEKTYPSKYHSHIHLLTHIKGGHHLYQVRDVESEFLNVLKMLPVDAWISTENFVDYTIFRGHEFTLADLRQMSNYLTYDIPGKYGKERKEIRKNNYRKFCNEPIIKGNIMLWASYGLLEIAYDTVDTTEFGKTYFSNYDGVKALKLTRLGAYILGVNKDYEAPKVKLNYELNLSQDNLMILVEGETTLTDNLLANYADKIGANRYAVSNESFLKSVTSKKDLKLKIDLFKQVINSDLPQNWETFFVTLDKKINPLTAVKEVLVFKIPSDDPELVKLLIQNQEIKKLLIKAEDYQIIVLQKDYTTLRNKLKSFGYLLS